ncbi:hypothetical protein BUALT_Bualt10G0140200 [Buddleja alternifolia]|uniref:Ubiquitin-like domain-containing protein n=1 Tax=Buddleja alternifolia TaxID=168488 RepID=A0AAV6WXV8_9LAMI|nr:hypothetical protein BUALT_Bualt10G0140200 [Buddleja alternifolia]
MGGNGGEQIIISRNDASESSQTTVEIKIKTLDSQTFTLRVDKRVPVPELKEQIASVTGVLSAQQRLICRGKVLNDDQLLSAYHVEDGHTLHLVVRQQQNSSDPPATDTTSSTGDEGSPDIVIGTFNVSGAFPDLTQLVSAILGSFGSGSEGSDLNQLHAEQPLTVPGLSGPINSSSPQSDQPYSIFVPVESLQSPVIPDLLTTLLLYLGNLRDEFIANAVGQDASSRNDAFYGSVLESAVCDSESGGVLTPELLAMVISSTRQLLLDEGAECLWQLEEQLSYQACVSDPLERSRIQSDAIRSGALIQSVGSSLLELGRAITTLQMGPTPADALVNAGNPVFVSSTGPNPIMVQRRRPLPPGGGSFGSIPVGSGSGLAGAGTYFVPGHPPRNIDIRIGRASFVARGESSSSQGQGQGGPVSLNNSVDYSGWEGQDGNPNNLGNSRDYQVQGIPTGIGSVSSGRSLVDQLLRSIFPGEHLNRNLPTSGSGSGSGLFPTISENIGARSNMASAEGTNSAQLQGFCCRAAPSPFAHTPQHAAMAEQTEKAFLKQPKVFLCSKKSGKGKAPGKGGNRYWKSIGLGFKTPREAVEGTYIDKKCPFTGDVSIRGRIIAGTCHSAKMMRTIIVRRNYLHWVKKYQRYEKRHSNIPAHISPCFRVKEGDHVIIGQPLSKTVRFNVLKVIPAGSSGRGKKAFTGIHSRLWSNRKGKEISRSSFREGGIREILLTAAFFRPSGKARTRKKTTEKAFLKQPKVFLCSKKSGKGKAPGKGGNRYWKSIGLGFKTPREAVEGTYIDKKCPFTGDVSIRGRIIAGTCHSAKMMRTIIVRRNYLHWVKKYQRYEKRHSNIPAHISPCFRVKEGDHVIIGQPLSKTVRFNVLKMIPAGSSGRGKKAFTGM